ncbi:MAG: hypothetical protein ABIM40_16080, partial [Pseudomonadota bacterium]
AMKAEADEEEKALPQDPHAAPGNVQDLVKGFFAQDKEQKDKGASAFKGAIALAQLRQFERALIEFKKLVKIDALRVPAAKNALKCHLATGSTDAAIQQYNDWFPDQGFPDEEIEGLRIYLQELLKKKGEMVELESRIPTFIPPPEPEPEPEAEAELEMADLDLSEEPSVAPEPAPPSSAPTGLVKPKSEIEAMAKAEEALDEEPIEICSMEITIEEGPAKGQCLELDVTTQRGNRLSLVLPGNEKNFFESLKVGQKLNDVQYFSHFVMFRGTGTVAEKAPITSGGRKGDYTVGIKMDPQ